MVSAVFEISTDLEVSHNIVVRHDKRIQTCIPREKSSGEWELFSLLSRLYM